MRKILVTGGTGFIGSGVVRALVARGDRVRSLDNDSRGSRSSLADIATKVELRVGDVRNREDVRAAAEGMDAVFHLAAINGTEFFYSKPHLVLEVATKGMMNVLDACREEGVRDLVVMSSSEAYQTPERIPTPEDTPLVVPDPLNPRYSYGSSKILTEMLALHTAPGVFDRVRVVRPHNVYGPRMGWEHVIPQLTKRCLQFARGAAAKGKVELPIQGDGSETRAFAYIDDFVDGFLRVADRGEHRGIYHIGTNEETTIRDLITRIGRTLHLDVTPIPGAAPKGGTRRRCPDITKVSKLGYVPHVSLDEGLKRTVLWYADHQAEAA